VGGFREHAKGFAANLRQPGMPAGEYLSKLVRNRWRARIIGKGCCGHPGEPGC
jgi:hypothetical protein